MSAASVRHQAGQALPLVLALGVLLLSGVGALAAFGWVHLAAARAQTGADLAAMAGARELRRQLFTSGSEALTAAELDRRLLAVAEAVARADGGRVVRAGAVAAGGPATVVEVLVAQRGPFGQEVRAIARAGLVVPAVAGDGPRGWASGGGYSGPLVYRDGKPMCPAVGAAFDLMDAAANAAGVDLVVNSGFRSDAEQAVLFARHPDPRWVAPPGRSRHRDATELDLNMGAGGSAHAWLRANGGRFGFVQRYSWEPWHWGYLPGCGGAGGAAAGRGVEAVVGETLPAWVPVRYRELVVRSARGQGVQPLLLAALLQAESGFRADAVSGMGAQGIAQFMPATARGMGLRDPFDPAQAVPAAARLLGGHLRRYGSVPLALAAYNAGPGAVARFGGVPPYAETRAYIARITALVAGGGGGESVGGVRLLPIPGRPV